MKKRAITFVLVLALVLTSFSSAFAEGTVTVPKDVVGTGFETAVTALVSAGVLSGYPDGTFLPQNTISRAEACVIVVKSLGASDADLTAAATSGFQDLAGYDWAAKYINYAAANGIVNGYPDGTFRPAGKVTYNEIAAILVQALGYTAADLTGTWPTNFSDKAKELGMLDGVPFAGASPALRGYVAMMDYSVYGDLKAMLDPITAETLAAMKAIEAKVEPLQDEANLALYTDASLVVFLPAFEAAAALPADTNTEALAWIDAIQKALDLLVLK